MRENIAALGSVEGVASSKYIAVCSVRSYATTDMSRDGGRRAHMQLFGRWFTWKSGYWSSIEMLVNRVTSKKV
jgi:hypothetical protein